MPHNSNGSLYPTFVLKHASVSDLGMRRTNNQDSIAVTVTNDVATWAARGHLLLVADGMGAHAAGELASKIAADNIPHTYFKLRDLYPPAALRQAIRDANSAIHAKGQSSIGFQGMGTTCSCLVLLPQGALVAHVGDSRVYRLRGQVLEQLTFDHSLVWEMAAAGKMNEQDVPAYIPKNVITRSLGPHDTVHIDLEGPYSAQAGDVFLLCSDGLSGQITDEELGAILQSLPPDEATETLVDLANFRGGPDNISVIVAKIDGELPANLDFPPPGNGVPAKSPKQMAPLLVAIGVCVGFLGYFLAYRLWAGAVVAAVGLVAALMTALTFGSRSASGCPPSRSLGGPYGNGPHRKIECPPNGRVVASLAEIVSTLRELPEKENTSWAADVDWTFFDSSRSQAVEASKNGDYVTAIRQYCRGIRNVMQQFREHRPTVDTSWHPL
jgi:serine/threonine protein phosphatase PrpC